MMKKVVLIVAVVVGTILAGCALFMGTARISVKGVSNQNTSLSTLSTLAVIIQSNEIAFSPDTFNVVIKKVEVIKDVTSPDWQTLFDSGTSPVNIVQGVTLTTSGQEIELIGGDYNGVAITFDPRWISTITLNSNDITGVGADTVYTSTNSTTNTTQTIYWATAALKQQLIDINWGGNLNDINNLATAINIDGGLDSVVLNMIFNTENMIRVWTNGTGTVTSSEFIAPGLSVSLN